MIKMVKWEGGEKRIKTWKNILMQIGKLKNKILSKDKYLKIC